MRAFKFIGIAVWAGFFLLIAVSLTGCSEKLEIYPLYDDDYFEFHFLNNPAEKQFGIKTILLYRISDVGNSKINYHP